MKSHRLLAVGLAFASVASAGAPDGDFIHDRLAKSASPDATVREIARGDLMGLSADELPALRAAVRAAAPLKPAQAEAVHDVVVYALTRQALLRLPSSGRAFMGVVLTENFAAVDPNGPGGVVVRDVLPGFVAGRFLHGGDVISGLTYGGAFRAFRTRQELSDFVGQLKPGSLVELDVRRGGRVRTVRLRLDARPDRSQPGLDEAENDQITRVTEEAAAAAEKTFAEEFTPNAAVE